VRYLIVPDSFKDCLSAIEVGLAIEEGILKSFPNASTTVIPISDGGEGFVNAILHSVIGYKVPVVVFDPLLRKIESYIGIINNGRTAIIEMAAASGLELLSPAERNPWITSSYGTGQLILKALDLRCSELIIGIGGSATNDAGLGMAKALGSKFYDKFGTELGDGGGVLGQLHSIDLTGMDTRLKNTSIQVATDVTNKLCGIQGATMTYGAQKGANQEMIQKLEDNMQHFANIIDQHFNIQTKLIVGGGAAGGLGAGLAVFLGAQLSSGFTLVSQIIQIENYIASADILITAEGTIDSQTTNGKTPVGVGKLGLTYNKPVYVFVGSAPDSIIEIQKQGITSVIPILRKPVTLTEAINNAPVWLRSAAAMLSHIIEASAGNCQEL